MPSIDKLALTCRLLYDERLLEQRKEIEKLEVKLFFKKFTNGYLARAKRRLNWTIRCKCRGCNAEKRITYPDLVDYRVACTFGPWLDNVLHERGFVVLQRDAWLYSEEQFENVPFVDDDCHVVEIIDMGYPSPRWEHICIGKRLWTVESINNPLIQIFDRVFGLVCHLGPEPLSSPPTPPSSPKMAPRLPPPQSLPITTTINQGLELQALKEQLAAQAAETQALKQQLAAQAADTQALKEQLEHVRDDTDNKRKRP